jgi:hypothetical protein
MTKAYELYDCSPDTSTKYQTTDNRRLLVDITGIFNFLASIGTSLLIIFGSNKLLPTNILSLTTLSLTRDNLKKNEEIITKNIKIHFIGFLLLICISLILFLYGLFEGGSGYSIFGLTNFIITFIYIILRIIDSNYRTHIIPFMEFDTLTFVFIFVVLLIISMLCLFLPYYLIKTKKHKKAKNNKAYISTLTIFTFIGTFLFSILLAIFLK